MAEPSEWTKDIAGFEIHEATITKAPFIVAAFGPPLRRIGYLMALYGSVLNKGAGSDFDFHITRHFETPDKTPGTLDEICAIIERHAHILEIVELDEGGHHVLSIFLNHLLDFYIPADEGSAT